MDIVFGLCSKLTLAQACLYTYWLVKSSQLQLGVLFSYNPPFTDGDTEAQRVLQHGQGGKRQSQDVNPGHPASEFTLQATLLLGHTTSERV